MLNTSDIYFCIEWTHSQWQFVIDHIKEKLTNKIMLFKYVCVCVCVCVCGNINQQKTAHCSKILIEINLKFVK